MDKTILTRVYLTDKNKEGKPFVNKFGKPYKKIAIKTELTGEEWLSSFIHAEKDERLSWKEGQQVIIKITQNGQYKNFEVADKIDLLEARVEALEKMFLSKPATNGSGAQKEDSIDSDSLPF